MAIDDWMAILYLLSSPQVDVRAITVVATGEAHAGPGGIWLDADDAAAPLDQRRRQRTGARADLQHNLIGPGMHHGGAPRRHR